MSNPYLEEGDACPLCSSALTIAVPDDCSCHNSPPCAACVDTEPACEECCWTNGDYVPEDVPYVRTYNKGISDPTPNEQFIITQLDRIEQVVLGPLELEEKDEQK